MESFSTVPGFCSVCGSILPELTSIGDISCYICKKNFNAKIFGDMNVEYTIHFNTYDSKKIQAKTKEEKEEADGPIVERKCPKCGHDKMSYATIQLRSVDEGQTVFFTCLKCKYKESENS